MDEVEDGLLQLYERSSLQPNPVIKLVYEAFGGNIYEGAAKMNFGDFSHRRRSQGKHLGLASGPGTPRAKFNALAEDFFRVSVPALEAFVLSEFKSILTSKYFGALSQIMEVSSRSMPSSGTVLIQKSPQDPTERLRKRDHDIEPHESFPVEDESKQRWVVSRDMINQESLRFITDGTKCPDCEQGTLYSTPDEGISHLREWHRVRKKTDPMLRDCLLPLPAALAERLSEELCELLIASRNILASTLRKLVALQSGVMHDEKFQGSERGIPVYLVDAFKLIVIFVCAVPEALHQLRWFYNDFHYTSRNLTSQKALSQRKVMDRLGEVMADLIRKAERTLVSLTDPNKENHAEHFMTSVGLNYLSLQIMFNLFQKPVHNRKKVSDIFTAYAKNLVSEDSMFQ